MDSDYNIVYTAGTADILSEEYCKLVAKANEYIKKLS